MRRITIVLALAALCACGKSPSTAPQAENKASNPVTATMSPDAINRAKEAAAKANANTAELQGEAGKVEQAQQ